MYKVRSGIISLRPTDLFRPIEIITDGPVGYYFYFKGGILTFLFYGQLDEFPVGFDGLDELISDFQLAKIRLT